MSDTKEITVGGAIVTVSLPYAVGHALTEAEAKALNQVRAENIGNNVRKFVNDSKGEDGKLSDAALKEIQAKVAEYDASYEFTLASAGGGGRARLDPLEKEAKAVARAYITAQLKEAGRKVKDVEKEKLDEEIGRLMEHPEVIKVAKKKLAEKAKLAESQLGDLYI